MGVIFSAPITEKTTIWEDNQSVIAYSQNALVNEKIKHRIGMKWHFLMDYVDQSKKRLSYLPSDQMVADMFTKPLQ
jgi:KUP system potassium uptake protein